MDDAPLQRFEYRELHMGVVARIVLFAPSVAAADSAARAAFERIAALEQIMSDYRSTSELNQLAARAGGPSVRVSEDLFLVLSQAQTLSRLSDGAFDVTAAPLVHLWREARASGALPAAEKLTAARRRVGWRNIELDPRARTARLRVPGMRIDLGGIAKGYAADAAVLVLRQRGIERALVELGGDIVVGAPPPGERGWRIALHDSAAPALPDGLSHAAISTSGDTEQFVVIQGRRYSHIVDPRTGMGLTERVAVTVVAPSGTLSDGLSTAVSVLGAASGVALVRAHFPEAIVHVRSAVGG